MGRGGTGEEGERRGRGEEEEERRPQERGRVELRKGDIEERWKMKRGRGVGGVGGVAGWQGERRGERKKQDNKEWKGR